MFFLGIAGPLMPYFLMMGILIAFTLELSTEKLRKQEKQPVNHHLCVVTAQTGKSTPEHGYYFYNHSDLTKQQVSAKNIHPFQSHLPPPGMRKEPKVICFNDSFPAEDYVGGYFGLSPPYRFVS